MFKIVQVLANVVGNIHNLNDKIEKIYSIWTAIYTALYGAKLATAQPTAAEMQQMMSDIGAAPEAPAAAAADAAIKL